MSEADQTPPSEPPATPPADPTPPTTGWSDGLPDDMKGYVENKGWKDPSEVLSSYQNLEKLRGVPETQLLRLPDDPSADGAMDQIYERLGRPEAPDAYTNVIGDNLPGETFSEISKAAHAAGLTDSQYQVMQQTMGELSAKMAEAQEAESVAAFDQWKSANPDGFANAARVMAEVGMNEDGVAALLSGDKTALYDFAAKIGAKTSESPVIQGEGDSSLSMSPQAAKSKITEKLSDEKFMERYTHSNAKIRQPAIEEMERLQKIANP